MLPTTPRPGALVSALAGLGALVPGLVACLVSWRLSVTSREEWKLLAFVPPVPPLAFAVYLCVLWQRDPTAGNLWPFIMVPLLLLTGSLFGLFVLARRFLSAEPMATRYRPDRRG